MGASILAISEEQDTCIWEDLHRANFHAQEGVISLRDSWHVVQRFYVPAERWGEVSVAIEAGLAEGARIRAASEAVALASGEVRRRSALDVGVAIAVTVIATIACEVWEYVPDGARGPAVFAGVLVALAIAFEGLARRGFAVLGAAAGVWYLLLLAGEAFTPFGSMFGGAPSMTWTLDTPQLAASAAGGLTLLALAAWRLLGRTR